MKQSPPILVWHSQADDYAKALRVRLPTSTIEVVGADHDSGTAPPATDGGRTAQALLAWKVPAGALSLMPSLRWVQVSGAGVDHFLDRPDLAPDVALTRSLGRFGTQVAEYTIGYLLHHLLGIAQYRAQQDERAWHRGPRPLLADRTVGIVGLGSLGLPIASALAALGTEVLAVRRTQEPCEVATAVFTPDTWRDLLPRCDALVLAAPKTADTAGMVDAAALAALPRGAVLVNVARGELVDEDALFAALEREHLGAAVLDVFAQEPLPADHPLWQQERAWITPHVAAPSEVDVIADEFAENYRRFVDNRDMINVVDRRRGY